METAKYNNITAKDYNITANYANFAKLRSTQWVANYSNGLPQPIVLRKHSSNSPKIDLCKLS